MVYTNHPVCMYICVCHFLVEHINTLLLLFTRVAKDDFDLAFQCFSKLDMGSHSITKLCQMQPHMHIIRLVSELPIVKVNIMGS